MTDIRYTITDLGILAGFVRADATGINDRGQIIGTLWTEADGAGDRQAFWWEDGRMRAVGKVRLNDLNNHGQAVGTKYKHSRTGISSFRAVILQNGAVAPLWDDGSLVSRATAINDSGQVVGDVMTHPDKIQMPEEMTQDGFIWQNGERRALSLPPDYRTSKAVAINNHGIVVGLSGRMQPAGLMLEQAVQWDGGKVELLGTMPGFQESRAVAINNRGQVLGRAMYSKFGQILKSAQQKSQGRWDRSNWEHLDKGLAAVIDEINALPKDEPAFRQQSFLWDKDRMWEIDGLAEAVNDQGQVVGWSGCDLSGKAVKQDAYAFLWQDGHLFDLNALISPTSGWILGRATGINNLGQIIGSGGHNGRRRAFLLTPEAN